MTCFLIWIVTSASCVQYQSTDIEAMQGDWKIIKAERLGKPWPKEELKKLSFQVKDNNFIIISNGPEPSQVELDPTTSPKQFRLRIKGSRANEALLGIYELKGKNLKICWARPGKPRPKKFNGGEDQFLFVMTRPKKANED